MGCGAGPQYLETLVKKNTYMRAERTSKKSVPDKKSAAPKEGIDLGLKDKSWSGPEQLSGVEREAKFPTPAEMRQSKSDDLLRRAAMEIKNLRYVNERMAGRARGWDEALSLFNNEPPRKGGSDMCAGTDISFLIELHLGNGKLG